PLICFSSNVGIWVLLQVTFHNLEHGQAYFFPFLAILLSRRLVALGDVGGLDLPDGSPVGSRGKLHLVRNALDLLVQQVSLQ
ncbi:unnamed protein product, partial [Linum tenue]